MDIKNLLGIDLKWYQKLYLKALSNKYFTYRSPSKTGLNFMLLLEELKKSSSSNEEKQMFEQIQKEWAELNKNLTLSYWT